MSTKIEAWDVRQSEATGHWYVNTGREIWKCFDEERARLIASAPELRAEVERLKAQIREGNARFSATVDAVVEERLQRCQGCGEVSARTLLCRFCTLTELEDHPNTVALRDLPF